MVSSTSSVHAAGGRLYTSVPRHVHRQTDAGTLVKISAAEAGFDGGQDGRVKRPAEPPPVHLGRETARQGRLALP
ncbi:MAG: hypothetical protein WA117_24540, partial [Verrucomicrobiia bacterium]